VGFTTKWIMKEAMKYSEPFGFIALRMLIGAVTLFVAVLWLRKPIKAC
jgi:drug/metabolite transporter (DMT)-like permease